MAWSSFVKQLMDHAQMGLMTGKPRIVPVQSVKVLCNLAVIEKAR